LFGKKANEVSFPELLAGLSKWERNLSEDPMKRPFAHLQRGQDGKYSDDDLVRIMQAGIEDVAGEFRHFSSNLYQLIDNNINLGQANPYPAPPSAPQVAAMAF
jgi:Ca2+-binding EF-hand superfamily protein